MEQFIKSARKNAQYTSKDAVVDFVVVVGTWVDEPFLARLLNIHYFSVLADECTDISTIEDLSVVCCWVKNGLPLQHFIEIISLKKAEAQRIYEMLVDCSKVKGVQISKLIGMGFMMEQPLFRGSTTEYKPF